MNDHYYILHVYFRGEDFEEHEAWVPKLFEPVRLKFFVPPAVPQPILFFLLEETEPTASVITLAAVHPKVRGKVWKEVVVFRDLSAVQIYKMDAYGHQHYRPFGSLFSSLTLSKASEKTSLDFTKVL